MFIRTMRLKSNRKQQIKSKLRLGVSKEAKKNKSKQDCIKIKLSVNQLIYCQIYLSIKSLKYHWGAASNTELKQFLIGLGTILMARMSRIMQSIDRDNKKQCFDDKKQE